MVGLGVRSCSLALPVVGVGCAVFGGVEIKKGGLSRLCLFWVFGGVWVRLGKCYVNDCSYIFAFCSYIFVATSYF